MEKNGSFKTSGSTNLQLGLLDHVFFWGNVVVFHCQNLPVAKHAMVLWCPLHHCRCKAFWRRSQAMPCLMHRCLWRWWASSWKAIPIALAAWPKGGEGTVVGHSASTMYQGEQRVADIAMALEKESGNSCGVSRHVAHCWKVARWACHLFGDHHPWSQGII